MAAIGDVLADIGQVHQDGVAAVFDRFVHAADLTGNDALNTSRQ